ncbi:unnamed protein product [Boreogadus saida]
MSIEGLGLEIVVFMKSSLIISPLTTPRQADQEDGGYHRPSETVEGGGGFTVFICNLSGGQFKVFCGIPSLGWSRPGYRPAGSVSLGVRGERQKVKCVSTWLRMNY